MAIQVVKVGQVVRATRDILLTNNVHVIVLSSATANVLPKGSEAEVMGVTPEHIELNCKDTWGWGLKLRVAKVVWGISFQ